MYIEIKHTFTSQIYIYFEHISARYTSIDKQVEDGAGQVEPTYLYVYIYPGLG